MVRIAVAQVEPAFGEIDANIVKTETVIRSAAARGAEVIVLPELVSSGYMFASRAEAYDLAESAGDGPATRSWLDLAAQLDVIVVAGFPRTQRARALQLGIPRRPRRVVRRVSKGAPLG